MKLKTIIQQVVFPNVAASALFALYTDAELHQQVTGSAASITDKLGDPFNLYNGFCFGENIDIKKDKLIVQYWRTEDWPLAADDSIVVLRFVEENGQTTLYLTHTDIPEDMAGPLSKGWEDFYWSKWKSYLATNQSI